MRKHAAIEAGHSAFTQSSYFTDKVAMRKQVCSKLSAVDVLDLFAGSHDIWDAVGCDRYYGIDNYFKGGNLPIDNRKALQYLDLSQVNIIDADAYGMPYEQIQMLYENGTMKSGTVVFFTCITGPMNRLSRRLIDDFGIDSEYKRTRTLFNRYGYRYFHQMLKSHGINEVVSIIHDGSMRKEYGYFIVK